MPLTAVFPTTDIHLVRENGGTQMDIFFEGGSATLTCYKSTPATPTSANIVDVNIGSYTLKTDYSTSETRTVYYARISPAAANTNTGEVWLHFVDSADSPAQVIAVRVRVYQSINKIWFGNNRATLFKERDNYVLSVYAQFSGLIGGAMTHIGDITGHHGTLTQLTNSSINGVGRDYLVVDKPYLDFSSDDQTKVIVWNSMYRKFSLSARGNVYYGFYGRYNNIPPIDLINSTNYNCDYDDAMKVSIELIGRICAVDSNVSSLTATTGGTEVNAFIRYANENPTSTAGTNATATATIGGGHVTGITLTGGGTGYPSDITQTKVFLSGGGGTGATAKVASVAGGVITSITFTGGSGYTSPPTVNIVRQAGATATATVSGGGIASITVTNAGGGYTTGAGGSEVYFIGDGSGANATIIIGSYGQITAINITSAGSGYTSAPTVVIVRQSTITDFVSVYTLNYLDGVFDVIDPVNKTRNAQPTSSRITFQSAVKKIYSGKQPENKKRNILIWGEGFTSGESTKFDAVAKFIQNKLTTDPINNPFNLLKDNLNVWSCYLASPDAGVTACSYLKNIPHSYLHSLPGRTGAAAITLSSTESAGYLLQYPPKLQDPTDAATLFRVLQTVGTPNSSVDTIVSGSSPTPNCDTVANAVAHWGAIGVSTTGINPIVYNCWRTYEHEILSQTRDTLLGLSISSRLAQNFTPLGSTYATPLTSSQANKWYYPTVSTRTIGLDTRRSNRNNGACIKYYSYPNNYIIASEYSVSVINELLDVVKYGTVTTDANYDIAKTWKKGAPDEGLIIIISNENIFSGASDRELTGKFTMGGPEGQFITVDNATGVFEHTVHTSSANPNPPIIVESFCQPVPTNPNAGYPKLDNILSMASTVAHEMCHSATMNFLDEYEDIDGQNNSNGTGPTTTNGVDSVELGANTTAFSSIFHDGTGFGTKPIDVSKVKWNWYRVEKASLIKTVDFSVSNQLNITLIDSTVDNINFWKYIKQLNRDIFISTREINANFRHKERLYQQMGNTAPLRITNISTTNVITLQYQTVTLSSTPYPTTIAAPFPDLGSDAYIYVCRNSPSSITDVKVLLDDSSASLCGSGMTSKTPLTLSTGVSVDADGTGAAIKVGTLTGGGGIATVAVVSGGSFYTKPPKITVGKPYTAPLPVLQAILTPSDTSVVCIKVLNGGSGYTGIPNVKIAGGVYDGTSPASAATATAVLSSVNRYCLINISNGGAGYKPPISITYPGGGSGASIQVYVLNGGGIDAYAKIIYRGSGYSTGATIIVSCTGATNATFNIAQVDSAGGILSVTQTSAGAGFVSPISFSYAFSSSPTTPLPISLLLQPIISSGAITDILILDPGNMKSLGSAGTTPSIIITISGGGATANATATIELAKNVEAINIAVGTGGSGYLRIPKVVVDPPPTGSGTTRPKTAVAEAIIGAYARVMDLPVIKDLYTNKRAYYEKTACSTPYLDNDNSNPTNPLPGVRVIPTTVTGLQCKRRDYSVGVFEGGATWNCGAYRPTGTSKMRNNLDTGQAACHFLPFNYPSQYFIVSIINPEMLGDLDSKIYNTFLIRK